MPLPADIAYGQVTGRFLLAAADDTSSPADSDALPDAIPVSGKVTFTPARAQISDAAATIIQGAYSYTLDGNGWLVDKTGNPPTLVAASSGDQWTWTATFAFTNATSPAAVSFVLLPNQTVDLRTVIPLDKSTGTPTYDVPTLGQLADVDTTGVSDGDALIYVAATDSWTVGTVSGGTGGTSDYTQLTNKPAINGFTLTTASTLADIGAQAAGSYATAAQGAEADSAVQGVVAGMNVTVDNTDPKHPVIAATSSGTGTVTSADITDATTVGKAVLTAADAPTARGAIGAGTSSLALGTTSTTALAGNTAIPAPSNGNPSTLGTTAPGTATAYSRYDHVHKMPSAADVGALPSSTAFVAPTRLVAGHALSADVTITPSDIGAATAAQGAEADSAVQPGDLSTVATTGAYTDLTGKPTLGTAAATDSTAYDAAGAAAAAQTAAEAASVPTTRTVNGHALSANVSLTAADIGADASGAAAAAQTAAEAASQPMTLAGTATAGVVVVAHGAATPSGLPDGTVVVELSA